MATKNWQIRPSTLFGLTLLSTVVVTPLPGAEDVMPFIGIIMYFVLKRQGHIKKFTLGDAGLIFLYLLVGIFALLYLSISIIAHAPWWKIILLGVVADIVATIFAPIPHFGDIASAMINAMAAIVIFGFAGGSILAIVVFFLSLIPGPSLGLNTLILVGTKVIASLIG